MRKKYYKHKIENLLNISRIVAVRYFELDRNFVGRTETHDFWEMVYVAQSEAICIADKSEIPLKEGEALFHKPGEPHSLRCNKKQTLHVFVIMFECRNEAIGFFENRKLLVERKNLALIYSMIEESRRTFELSSEDPYQKKLELLPSPALAGQQLIKNYLEILLINLIRNENEKENSPDVFLLQDAFNERIAGLVIEYMKEHLEEKITVSNICEAIHYNKSYLFKEFKTAVGCSMMAYFARLKIERAKQLLRETYLPISSISEKLAFDNPNYFTKTFKRLTGYTPSQYRLLQRNVTNYS